jgi:hypothetical protein
VDIHIPMNVRSWAVSKEASRAGHGQIDLLLESPGFGIAIENKIHAQEQFEQLERYRNYLHSRPENLSTLIYLTLDGKTAYTAGKRDYYRISYKEHILAWLDSCLRATYNIIPVNQALIQYRTVVRRLTNQNLESEFMKPVIDFVRQNPDIVRFNDAMQEAVRQASCEAWTRLKECIKKTFDCDYEVSFHQERNWGFNSNGETALILRPRAGNGVLHVEYPVWIEPDFINDQCLGIGICTDGMELSPSMAGILDKVRSEMEKLPQHGYWNPPNGKPRYPVGWRNLMKGNYAEQSAQLLSDKRIESICEDIRDYLERLMQAISAAKHKISMSPPTSP